MAKKKKIAAREAKPEKLEWLEPIEDLPVHRFMRIFIKILKEKIEEHKGKYDKKNPNRWGPSIPAYVKTGSRSRSDAEFIYAVHGVLAHFSWADMKRLLKACKIEMEHTDFTTTWKMAERGLYQMLGVEVDEKGVRYRLADRDATLAMWPVKVKEESVMSKDKKEGKKKRNRDEEPEEKKGKSKKDKSEKAGKKAKGKKAVKLSDDSTVSKLKDRPKGGPKTKLLNLIPRKGISFKKVVSKAVEEGLPKAKIGAWLTVMSKNGFVGIE